jgi:small nuclear ribonucleoprotein
MPAARAIRGMPGRPLDVLEETLGEEVTVHLKGGEIYEGVLEGYDQHMNLVVEGENTTIIRGDNVVSIQPQS